MTSEELRTEAEKQGMILTPIKITKDEAITIATESIEFVLGDFGDWDAVEEFKYRKVLALLPELIGRWWDKVHDPFKEG